MFDTVQIRLGLGQLVHTVMACQSPNSSLDNTAPSSCSSLDEHRSMFRVGSYAVMIRAPWVEGAVEEGTALLLVRPLAVGHPSYAYSTVQ